MAQQEQKPFGGAQGKPNILVIFGDDIDITNLSCYSDGVMGYETPNIDRIANEGLRFLHYYGEQSCTAGRAAFLTGQHGIRTGLTKVGFPGAPMGMSQLDPSIGGLLKSLGYATGQFGKNHVGDRNETLPTVNGFDEFFGNLYHLNAEEEPELPDYPKDPAFKAQWGPRGVLECKASDTDDATEDPRFGKIGKQTINDTGPLTKKRMETIDDETSPPPSPDGYDQSKFLTSVEGTVGKNNGVKSARNSFYYTDDDGLLVALRLGDYKASFAEQRMPGTMAVWAEPFSVLRLTKLYNLMQDPYERADITSNTYWDWVFNHVPQVYQGMGGVMTFLASFDEFPPRSTPPSFNPANMLEQKLREIKAKQKLERAFPMLRAESEKARVK